MYETEVKIQLSLKGKFIYGTLRGDYSKPLVILCHGYGGWMHEMLLYNGSRALERAGFATLRLSMYGGGENSRNIAESDVMTHAADIDDVVNFVRRKGAKWVGVAGHSYSGLAIVYSKAQQFDAAVLWDPTHTDGYDDPKSLSNLKEDFILLKEQKMYISGAGSGYVYAETVFNNDYPKSDEMATKFDVPTLVVNASWSQDQQRYGKKYVNAIAADARQVVIPDSSHPFTEDGVADRLFKVTADYFEGLLNKEK